MLFINDNYRMNWKKKKKEWIGCCFSSGTVSSKQSFENPYRYVQMTCSNDSRTILVFSVSLKWPLLITLGNGDNSLSHHECQFSPFHSLANTDTAGVFTVTHHYNSVTLTV